MQEILEYTRNLIEAVPVGLVAYESEGPCVSANRAAVRILGVSFEKLLSRNFRTDDSWIASGLLEAAEKALTTGIGCRLDTCLPAGRRKLVPLDNRFQSFVSGRRKYLLHIVIDAPEPGGGMKNG